MAKQIAAWRNVIIRPQLHLDYGPSIALIRPWVVDDVFALLSNSPSKHDSEFAGKLSPSRDLPPASSPSSAASADKTAAETPTVVATTAEHLDVVHDLSTAQSVADVLSALMEGCPLSDRLVFWLDPEVEIRRNSLASVVSELMKESSTDKNNNDAAAAADSNNNVASELAGGFFIKDTITRLGDKHRFQSQEC